MDFFDAQDRARKSTGKLLALYAVAVVLIILSVYVVALLILGYLGGSGIGTPWQPGLLLFVSALVLLLIISGTIIRVAQLRKGGSAVAEMLGGRKAEPSTTDFGESQLIHVVEEMAIASGMPVPDIYILDNETNINAFAAGFTTDDAAIGVTRGAIDQLSRDELQGVIAHEFSHIFNGDMRLNIRLIGILNGILLLHIMGMIVMRGTLFSGGARVSSSGNRNKDGGQGAIAILLLGLSLVVIGYIGMLFGRMIQAAVSRQREYLADAAAVQYTRNPDGIAGALEKIGRTTDGGKIEDGHSMEFSHMFFANSFHTALDKLFATHPPLKKRISAIRPGNDPESIRKKKRIDQRLEADRLQQQTKGSADRSGSPAGALADTLPITEMLMASIGTMESGGVDEASKLINSIPDELMKAAREPMGAEAVIYSLLLVNRERSDAEFPDWAKQIIHPELVDEVSKLLPEIHQGKREWSLPLAVIAMPALRNMSESQYRQFRTSMKEIIHYDNEVTLFEFAIEKLVEHRLDSHFKKDSTQKIRHHHLKSLKKEITVVLSALANISEENPDDAWQKGVATMKKAAPENIRRMSPDEYTIDDLDSALDEMNLSANPVKRYLIRSMIFCALSDDKLSIEELELLRAMSEAIGCPIPLHVVPRS